MSCTVLYQLHCCSGQRYRSACGCAYHEARVEILTCMTLFHASICLHPVQSMWTVHTDLDFSYSSIIKVLKSGYELWFWCPILRFSVAPSGHHGERFLRAPLLGLRRHYKDLGSRRNAPTLTNEKSSSSSC